MSKNLRDKILGSTIEEWIEKVPGKLSIDAVGLWQIVSFGREGFGLSGGILIDFVRRSILELFSKVARSVIGAMDNVHLWALVDYGQSRETATDAIVFEWVNFRRRS